MDLANPHRALIPTLDGDVLVVLAGTTRPLTGRDVARLARRGSPRAVADVLDRLVTQGLVDREAAGRAYLHSLNREHVIAPLVEELADVFNALLARLRREFGDWPVQPVHASVFGSAARREGDPDSDIDLFIVRPAGIEQEEEPWSEQIEALAEHVLAWTGNHAGIVQVDEDGVAELGQSAPPVVQELRRDAIDLVGAPLRALVGDAS